MSADWSLINHGGKGSGGSKIARNKVGVRAVRVMPCFLTSSIG